MKRILTLVLCLAIMMSLGLSAFAVEGEPAEIEVPMEAPVRTPTEAPEEVPAEVPAEVPEKLPAELPEEIPADIPDEVHEEVEAEPAAIANGPVQAVVIAIEAPATIKNLKSGEGFAFTGESKEYGGTLTFSDGTNNGFILKKWVTYFKVAKTGVSKYEGSEIFVKMFYMGDIVDIAERGEVTSKVVVDGVEAEIENRFLLFPDQVPYSEWTGFSKVGVGVYDNPWLRGQPEKFPNKNTEYKVIADMGNCFLVNSGDYFGYIPKDGIMAVPKNFTVDEHGAPAAESAPAPEWTPPKN